jgi:NADH-quinone oxidoreductase subunit F
LFFVPASSTINSVDLHIVGAEPTAAEREAVDALLGPPSTGWVGGRRNAARDSRASSGGWLAAREQRDLLLPALHAAQNRAGWISRGALNYICRRLGVPPADAWGVATFYHLFHTTPTPPTVAHVCDDIACRLQGAEAMCAELALVDRDAGADWTWHRSPCLGQCDRAPAALIVRAGAQPSAESIVGIERADEVVARLTAGDAPAPHGTAGSGGAVTAIVALDRPRLLARVGTVDPSSLDAYRASGGYQALAKAFEVGAAAVIQDVVASNLLGRGGAAFPTGRKWEAVAREPDQPHYLVCNADESEPGTFKDRVLLEEDPFAIVEAMTIAGYATGCTYGFLYLRGEYPLARTRMQAAIDAARSAGLLGARILDREVAFDLEIRSGAGAYICGEETALFNSIEGKRGEPRSKPPFPVQVGLFGKPTLVNNVETLANIPGILLEGGRTWAGIGTQASTGTRLFCLSGHVGRPGLYEAPFGITLGALLTAAGGVAGGRALQALLLGGAAGTFVGPDALDLRLTFEDVRAAGATLGSGVVMVFDDTADVGDALLRIATFMRDESCGQCVPCRVGTVRQVELLTRLIDDRKRSSSPGSPPRSPDVELLTELGQAMRDASICGLGQTASSAIESAIGRLRLFRTGDSA